MAKETPSAIPSPASDTPALRTSALSVIAWSILGCLLLVGSGVARVFQERRFDQEKGYLETCPFPLKDIPVRIGGWRLIEGGESALDPMTLRITGATNNLMRVYIDDLTGVVLQVLVLFGPAEPVAPHTPEICFPASGYTPVDEPADRVIKDASGKTYVFRSGVFAKSGGRAMIREEAYYSFRLNGQWSPHMPTRFPRKNPGIFKIQIQRRVGNSERRDQDEPIEQFLSLLMAEIEGRIPEPDKSAAKVAATNPTPVGR
jgi:hypothetical protein